MDFQDLLAKNGGFGWQNMGRDGAMLSLNELVLTFGGSLPLCHFWRKSIKKCDRESADRQTNAATETN